MAAPTAGPPIIYRPGMPSPAESAQVLSRALTAAADPAAAGPMAAYMRDRFVFLGLPKPARVAATRDLVRALPVEDAAWLHALAEALWGMRGREHVYVAVDALDRHRRALDDGSIAVLGRLAVTAAWWDSVDALNKVIGRGALEHPAWDATLEAWADDPDLWLRRIAVIHQLGRKERTDTVRLERAIARNVDHPDFFVRKAIGWALREYARTDPGYVRAVVARHPLSPLSRREALKHLGEPEGGGT